MTGQSTVPGSQGDHFLLPPTDVTTSHFSASPPVEMCAFNAPASVSPYVQAVPESLVAHLVMILAYCCSQQLNLSWDIFLLQEIFHFI